YMPTASRKNEPETPGSTSAQIANEATKNTAISGGFSTSAPPARLGIQRARAAAARKANAPRTNGWRGVRVGSIRNGAAMLAATSPKNSPRATSGWPVTNDSSTPATVNTAVAMPSSTGTTRNQSVRLSSASAADIRSGPVTSLLAAKTT